VSDQFEMEWGGLRLMIVEDHEKARQILRQLAEAFGIGRIIECESAESALETLETSSVDVVCTDLHMPGMGGIGLLRAIRNDLTEPWNRSAGCIAVTADDRPTTVALTMRAGADFYMTKPVVPQAFSTRLSVAARRAHDRRLANRRDLSSLSVD
jgi:two-component system, chemotaxis family, chemotaxis protein CheY